MRRKVFSDIFYNVLPKLGSASQFRLVSMKKTLWHKYKLSEERKAQISKILKSQYLFLFLRTLCIQSHMLPDVNQHLKYITSFYDFDKYMDFFLGQIGYQGILYRENESVNYYSGAAAGGIFFDPKTFVYSIDLLSSAALYGHIDLCKKILSYVDDSFPHWKCYYTLGKAIVCAALSKYLDICDLIYQYNRGVFRGYDYLQELMQHQLRNDVYFYDFFFSLELTTYDSLVKRLSSSDHRGLESLRQFLKYKY